MAIETKNFIAEITDLKKSTNNPRKISKDGLERLKKSLQDFPEMISIREVVVDENMIILGGHQRVRALQELGEKKVYVKQVIGLTPEQKKEFIVKDNQEIGNWDFDKLAQGWDVKQLLDWGIGFERQYQDYYSSATTLMGLEIPTYKPQDKKPDIKALARTGKAKGLLAKIEALDCPEELKEILRFRAAFFVDFNFQNIADYYANEADEDTKEMFKRLGMVIVVPKDAVKLGIAKLVTGLKDRRG